MRCPHCSSTATTGRPDRTAHGYRRFRCRECGRGFNERAGSALTRLQLPTDVVFLIVLWRLRRKLSLRDLAEILLLRGLLFSHEAVREWEAKLALDIPVAEGEPQMQPDRMRDGRGRELAAGIRERRHPARLPSRPTGRHR